MLQDTVRWREGITAFPVSSRFTGLISFSTRISQSISILRCLLRLSPFNVEMFLSIDFPFFNVASSFLRSSSSTQGPAPYTSLETITFL